MIRIETRRNMIGGEYHVFTDGTESKAVSRFRGNRSRTIILAPPNVDIDWLGDTRLRRILRENKA